MLDVNATTCVTFREMGKGHSSIERFCMLMNIPPPMTLKAYQNCIPPTPKFQLSECN